LKKQSNRNNKKMTYRTVNTNAFFILFFLKIHKKTNENEKLELYELMYLLMYYYYFVISLSRIILVV